MGLNYGELIDVTNTARREHRIVVQVDGKDRELTGVVVAPVSLDEGKSALDVVNGKATLEGHSHIHPDVIVRLMVE